MKTFGITVLALIVATLLCDLITSFLEDGKHDFVKKGDRVGGDGVVWRWDANGRQWVKKG